jgi:hypothetical protein
MTGPLRRGFSISAVAWMVLLLASALWLLRASFFALAAAGLTNITSTPVERGHDEFELAGLNPTPSRRIKAPRVLESPVNCECRLTQIVQLTTTAGLQIRGRDSPDQLAEWRFRIDRIAWIDVALPRSRLRKHSEVNKLRSLALPAQICPRFARRHIGKRVRRRASCNDSPGHARGPSCQKSSPRYGISAK